MSQVFTPRVKKILQMAGNEAFDLGHDYIGTEHILLGMLLDDEGVSSQVFDKFKINRKKMHGINGIVANKTLARLLASSDIELVKRRTGLSRVYLSRAKAGKPVGEKRWFIILNALDFNFIERGQDAWSSHTKI